MRGWRIGRIMGIDIAVDLSWFVIVFLMVYTLGFLEFPRELHPGVSRPREDTVSITLGIAASLLLFASVLAHELSHSWMAIQRGIPVKRITLFIFGGVAQIAREPDRPFSEFLIAIMGPLMSIALAAIFGSAWLWLRIINASNFLGISLTPLVLLTGILAQTNGSLALFNLAPGFPLDGGRVLRAILWGLTHNIRRATLWASRTGKLIAVIMIAIGGWLLLTEFNTGGIWYALIGTFLWNAAGEGYQQTIMLETLRGVAVSQLMTHSVGTVSPDVSISQFVDLHLLHHRDQTFVVSDGIAFQGIIGMEHLRRIPRTQWNLRRVRDVMTPSAKIPSLDPNMTAADALVRLSTADASELPVIEAGQVIGFLGQSEFMRYLKLKAE